MALKARRAAVDQPVLVGPRGGRLRRTNFRRRQWTDCLEALAIPYRGPHHMRHKFATLMLNAGVALTAVSRMLGHSQASTTLNIYAHFMADDVERVRQEAKRLFG